MFRELHLHKVLLEGALLKPNMITYGSEHPKKKENNIVEEAVRTVRALSRTVPPALAGITVFFWLFSSYLEDKQKRKLLCIWTPWTKSLISGALGFWASLSEEPYKTAPLKLGEDFKKTWMQAKLLSWQEQRLTLSPSSESTKVQAIYLPMSHFLKPSTHIDWSFQISDITR